VGVGDGVEPGGNGVRVEGMGKRTCACGGTLNEKYSPEVQNWTRLSVRVSRRFSRVLF
jgi:hypothetical protein